MKSSLVCLRLFPCRETPFVRFWYVINNEDTVTWKDRILLFSIYVHIRTDARQTLAVPSDTSNMMLAPATVPHTCNPNTFGGWNRRTSAPDHPRLYNKALFHKAMRPSQRQANQPMRGQWDGPVGEVLGWLPKFNPWNLCKGRRRERTPQSCPLPCCVYSGPQ